MKKCQPYILTIIAVVFVTISFIFGYSSVGEDWAHFWDNFELKQLLICLTINILMGLLLGVFLFRKRSYIERIKLTLPITFIVFSLYSFYGMIDYYYGLSEYYNYFSAKEDLKKGKVQILIAGQLLENDSKEIIEAKDSLRQIYGFKLLNVGIYSNGLQRYNEVMEEYLIKKNGKDWEKKLRLKIDSVDKEY